MALLLARVKKVLTHFVYIIVVVLSFAAVNVQASDYASIAVEDLQLLVEKGNQVAQYHLGMLYFAGKNVKTDYKVAVMWL